MNSPECKMLIISEMITTMALFKEEFDAKIDDSVRFEINDCIPHEYDGLGELVTHIKVHKYQKTKLERALNIHTFMTNQHSTNADKFVSKQSHMNALNALKKYDGLSFDEFMGGKTEDQVQQYIGETTDSYKLYNESAHRFLSRYGYFNNVTVEQIHTRENLRELIRVLFDRICDNIKCCLNERFNTKGAYHFKKMMEDPHMNPAQDGVQRLYRATSSFPNHAIANRNATSFRFNLFTLYALLKGIKETKVFLNEILNAFAEVSVMDKLYAQLDDVDKQYIKDKRLNRSLLPTSWMESFLYFFRTPTSTGEWKLPLSDYFMYIRYSYKVAGIENQRIIYENKQLNGECMPPTRYNYIQSIFGIEWNNLHHNE